MAGPRSWRAGRRLHCGERREHLAYAIALWQPGEAVQAWEEALVRCWHGALKKPEYTLEQAWADWKLSIEHCLHIPIEWCTNPEDVKNMRWVWETQLVRLLTLA